MAEAGGGPAPGRWQGPGRRGDALALVAGVLLVLAFAPFHLVPLAVLAPGLLFWLWLPLTPAQAARRGFAFGIGFFLAGVHWVYVSIHVFGQTAAPLAALMTGLFVLVLALYPALQGAVSQWLVRRLGRSAPTAETTVWALLAVYPALWLLFEWLRGWLFTGFPWLQLGDALGGSPLAGWAPLVGSLGLGGLAALSGGALVLLVIRRGRARRRVLIGLLGGWLLSVPLLGVPWTQPEGDAVSVALPQGDVDQNEKWRPGALDRILALYVDMTREQAGTDLVIWPETAVPAFYEGVAEDPIEPLAAEMADRGGALLVGAPHRDPAGRYYNTLINPATGQVYRKRHLVPFGEYLPFDRQLRGLVEFFDLPMSDFSAGPADQPPMVAAGLRLGVAICYEGAFPGLLREQLPSAGVLVNVSNDAWWGNTIGPHQHLQIAAMRSLESGRPQLRATNNGITAAIDHHGQVVERLPQFTVATLETEVVARTGSTPYTVWGDRPLLLGIGLLLAGLLRITRRNRPA
ncbi:MAG: apolipoprotein N-acyltransferase [Pseudomonadota bacterium]